jgi:hypothetical protein
LLLLVLRLVMPWAILILGLLLLVLLLPVPQRS